MCKLLLTNSHKNWQTSLKIEILEDTVKRNCKSVLTQFNVIKNESAKKKKIKKT